MPAPLTSLRILALDASAQRCGAALYEGQACLATVPDVDSRRLATALPSAIAPMLADHDRLDAVAVTVGPGSFSGLRGAIALAEGIALANGAAVVGVTVADALRDAANDPAAWVALCARLDEHVFLDDGSKLSLHHVASLPAVPAGTKVIGNGAMAFAEGSIQHVTLAAVARVGAVRLGGERRQWPLQPIYLEPLRAQPPQA